MSVREAGRRPVEAGEPAGQLEAEADGDRLLQQRPADHRGLRLARGEKGEAVAQTLEIAAENRQRVAGEQHGGACR